MMHVAMGLAAAASGFPILVLLLGAFVHGSTRKATPFAIPALAGGVLIALAGIVLSAVALVLSLVRGGGAHAVLLALGSLAVSALGILVSFVCAAEMGLKGASGRPLRSENGAPILADAVERADWSSPIESLESDATRAAQWIDDARAEHASIASFAELARDLAVEGAPPELVESALRAAIEEIGHAKSAFTIASRHAGKRLGPGAIDGSNAHRYRLARESFIDGMIGEGTAARSLQAQSEHEKDPAIAAILAKMAHEEAGHAELAKRIVFWAASVGR